MLSTAFALLALASTTGCSVDQLSVGGRSGDTAVLTGRAMGGQQPVSGGTVALYTVATTGDGVAAKSMLTKTVSTDVNGNFSITGLYACTSATQVYLTVTGGNPGLSGNNPNLLLMTALGSCSALTSSTFVTINELTTIAAVAGLQPYLSSAIAVGSSSYDANALAADFTMAGEFVSTATGTAPGVGIASGYSDPTTLINTLGDIIAPCINSIGGTAGDGSSCGRLFTYATPTGGTAPTNTVAALLNILNHPTIDTTLLFNLATPSSPYQPELSAAPASFFVKLVPPAATVTRTFYVFPESDKTVTPLYTLVNNATKTIDMTMYELVDTTFSGYLVAACKRGVVVRVILDQNDEKSSNTAAYNQLNAQTNCSAAWANPQFQVTHQKSFIVDGTTVAIMSLNLTSRYYSETRDYALVENDAIDIAAIEATFNSDYNSTTDFSYLPPYGNNLIWSPTTAQASLVNLINNATTTLLVENEEMSATNIVTALENACKRGVTVHIAMTDTGSYHTNYTALENAGCGVHTYADNSTTLYIHAKAILADYGTSGVAAYMGSINFSTASMTENRELGLYVTDATSQQTIYNTITSDYAGAPAY